ncbi:MAG TPA: hypothetical protein VKA97_00740, partial [Pyrinomonadaceae bacterium]|nr:hypothetical protein [Pyrinomonadaceae bacterium]
MVLLLVSLSLFSSCSQQTTTSVSGTAVEVSGTVVEVVDGDTLTISDAQNTYREIRLKGIDAPEHGQKFGDASRDYLARLVFGKYVRIEYENVCSVPLWFIIAQKKQPQRHKAHRGCTEKKPDRDFSCKA